MKKRLRRISCCELFFFPLLENFFDVEKIIFISYCRKTYVEGKMAEQRGEAVLAAKEELQEDNLYAIPKELVVRKRSTCVGHQYYL